MSFHNQLKDVEQLPESGDDVLFNSLVVGDTYLCIPGGQYRTVIEKRSEYITVRRDDGWITQCNKGCFVWDREVIRVYCGNIKPILDEKV